MWSSAKFVSTFNGIQYHWNWFSESIEYEFVLPTKFVRTAIHSRELCESDQSVTLTVYLFKFAKSEWQINHYLRFSTLCKNIIYYSVCALRAKEIMKSGWQFACNAWHRPAHCRQPALIAANLNNSDLVRCLNKFMIYFIDQTRRAHIIWTEQNANGGRFTVWFDLQNSIAPLTVHAYVSLCGFYIGKKRVNTTHCADDAVVVEKTLQIIETRSERAFIFGQK